MWSPPWRLCGSLTLSMREGMAGKRKIATQDQGIEWSAPVRVTRGRGGKLLVELPQKAVDRMAVGEGDVVSFTAFYNGGIEVWSIRKSPYSSLGDAGVAERLSKKARSQ